MGSRIPCHFGLRILKRSPLWQLHQPSGENLVVSPSFDRIRLCGW
jgi:hypothetical protein